MIVKRLLFLLLSFICINNSFASKSFADTTYYFYTSKDSSKIEINYIYKTGDTLIQTIKHIDGKYIFFIARDTLVIQGNNVYRKCVNNMYSYLIVEKFINQNTYTFKSENFGRVNFVKLIPISIFVDEKNFVYKFKFHNIDAMIDLNQMFIYSFDLNERRINKVENLW